MNRLFSNKKYRIFLFFSPVAVAIFYLIIITDFSYIFNIPMTMAAVHAGMHMRQSMGASVNGTGTAKSGSFDISKIKNTPLRKTGCGAFAVCLECRNIPAASGSKIIIYRRFYKYVYFIKSLYHKRFIHNIAHPPKPVSI